MNVLVNEKKKKRAKHILKVLDSTPKNEEDGNLKLTFSRLIKEDKVSDKDVLEYVYTKLGGLVRTEVEHKKAKAKAKETKKSIASGRKAKK